MPTCNLHPKGRTIRLIAGLMLVLISLILGILILAEVLRSAGGWWAAGATAFCGLFMIYEARTGWCVLRALGVRTKI